MPLQSPAFVTVNPSYIMPEIVLPYSQASGAWDLLAGGEPLVRLGSEDQYAYIKTANIRTNMAAYNQIPSVDIVMDYISSPTYLQRVRAEYDHHDTANAGRWGVSIVEANRLGMRQGHNQLARSALLFGYNPANGEGLANTVGATSINLPADPFGNDTVVTYDNGAMAFFLNQQIAGIKTRTNQLGIGRKFTITGPQRVLSLFEYGVVQLTQVQRVGAGSTSTSGVVKDVLDWNGDEIQWTYDDTLVAQGAGGNDLIIITMPEVEKPNGTRGGNWNTNAFAELSPGLEACTLMLCDKAAPTEIPVPLAGGAIDVLSEFRVTPGWGVRGEAVCLISMQFQ
jgi:hypothetical protein